MSKKHKFDLTWLVHHGYLKDGQELFFVSDPSKSCKVAKQPNGEFKVIVGKETMTVHAFSQKCLGMDPRITLPSGSGRLKETLYMSSGMQRTTSRRRKSL